MKTLNIDLNKLTTQELKFYIALAEKSEEEEKEDERKTEIIEEKKVDTTVFVTKAVINREEKFDKAYLLHKKGLALSESLIKTWGYSCGQLMLDFKRYLDKKKLPYNLVYGRKTESRIKTSSEEMEKLLEQIYKEHSAGLTITQSLKKVLGYASGTANKRFKDFCRKKGYQFKVMSKEEILKIARDKNPYIIKQKPKIPESWNGTRLKLAEASKDRKPTGFPALTGLTSDASNLLEGMVKNMVKTQGLPLKYEMEGSILGIETKDKWERFIVSFMLNSNKIAKYFGIPNKFRLKDKIAISYNG